MPIGIGLRPWIPCVRVRSQSVLACDRGLDSNSTQPNNPVGSGETVRRLAERVRSRKGVRYLDDREWITSFTVNHVRVGLWTPPPFDSGPLGLRSGFRPFTRCARSGLQYNLSPIRCWLLGPISQLRGRHKTWWSPRRRPEVGVLDGILSDRRESKGGGVHSPTRTWPRRHVVPHPALRRMALSTDPFFGPRPRRTVPPAPSSVPSARLLPNVRGASCRVNRGPIPRSLLCPHRRVCGSVGGPFQGRFGCTWLHSCLGDGW